MKLDLPYTHSLVNLTAWIETLRGVNVTVDDLRQLIIKYTEEKILRIGPQPPMTYVVQEFMNKASIVDVVDLIRQIEKITRKDYHHPRTQRQGVFREMIYIAILRAKNYEELRLLSNVLVEIAHSLTAIKPRVQLMRRAIDTLEKNEINVIFQILFEGAKDQQSHPDTVETVNSSVSQAALSHNQE